MTSYVGAQDPDEADRLAAQAAGGLDELRRALALHPPEPAARALELGCGAGAFTRALLDALPDATIVATDIDEQLLAAARQRLAAEVRAGRVTFARADARDLPFPARSFGLVACRFLLMHLADPLVAVAEMYRVAAVGGVAVAIEPDWGHARSIPTLRRWTSCCASPGSPVRTASPISCSAASCLRCCAPPASPRSACVPAPSARPPPTLRSALRSSQADQAGSSRRRARSCAAVAPPPTTSWTR